MAAKTMYEATWQNQTTLGRVYGKSAIEFGRMLVQYGLKMEDGKASDWAYDEFLATNVNTLYGEVVVWNRDPVIAFLRENDVFPVSDNERKLLVFVSDWKVAAEHNKAPWFEKGYVYEKKCVELTGKIVNAKLLEAVEDQLMEEGFKGIKPSYFVDRLPAKKPKLARKKLIGV